MERTIEFVLEQSSSGHHVLFERDLVRQAFHQTTVVEPKVVDGAAALLDALARAEDLGTQRASIAQQPDEVKRLFVRLYFDYLAGFMSQRGVVYH